MKKEKKNEVRKKKTNKRAKMLFCLAFSLFLRHPHTFFAPNK